MRKTAPKTGAYLLAALCSLACIGLAGLVAAPPQMGVDELRPGMVGIVA